MKAEPLSNEEIEAFQLLAWRVLHELKASREAKAAAPVVAPPAPNDPPPPRPKPAPRAPAPGKVRTAGTAGACGKAHDLVGKRVAALVVLAYLRPGAPGEAQSPWWSCRCERCGEVQEHQGHRLRNAVPSCRKCGMVS